MNLNEMLYLGDEGVHRLEHRVRFPRRRLVDLRLAPYEVHQPVVAEDPVVDYRRAFGYVAPIRLDALGRSDVALAGDLRVAVPICVHGAGDADLVAGDAPRLAAVGEPELQPAVDGYELLVDPDLPRQHRVFLDYRAGRVDLHPPQIGGVRGHADCVHYRLELRVVGHQIDHEDELLAAYLGGGHNGAGRPDVNPAARFASPSRRAVRGFAVGDCKRGPASGANLPYAHEKKLLPAEQR